MTIKDRILSFFAIPDEDEDEEFYEEHEEEAASESSSLTKGRSNIVSLHTQKNVKLVLYEPRTYEEATEIADQLKSHRPVVVNLQMVRRETASRIIDFLSGTVYALGGNIQKLGTSIFIFTPANVDVQGTITDLLKDERN
ncbi:cell division protein SepF [Hazenella sp. IB182357]|uniref:Cell division protein SepF n=1 Tax=Polycladospora coralii TaxID=2771432 RepID=A0A926N8K8_9BACL|nr:cell division protein SepF [Polycladospora coralii]MBD1371337.1 cell division protein SepF [Polycladospora coralii]MBS7530305.1 cell division protein SepF [Polycladospora coralii]